MDLISQQLMMGAAGSGGPKLYVEDVFSTWLYTGNGSTQTITNGIELSGKGGLVWIKHRTVAYNHALFDTARGSTKRLVSNGTGAEDTQATSLTSFDSSGFTLGADSGGIGANISGGSHASWTFRKAAKFFDVVTYTGTGSARTVAHNLGSVPGTIIVKRTDSTDDWLVYHRSVGATKGLYLNDTSAEITASTFFNNTEPTSTVFTVGTNTKGNASGGTYVAYLFAHDAGGFGDSGNDSVVKCGSATGGGTVNLGWEPQWILFKGSDTSTDWYVVDAMRGMPVGGNDAWLKPNLSDAEGSNNVVEISSTGFSLPSAFWGSINGIYIAIRRGPMKTPTDATKVFSVASASGEPSSTAITSQSGVLTDALIHAGRLTNGGYGRSMGSRLTGSGVFMQTESTAAETNYDSFPYFKLDNNSFAYIPAGGYFNNSGGASDRYAFYTFRRAPGFFDAVCYTGTGANRTVSHNLSVAPELMIVKRRNSAADWLIYHTALGNTKGLFFDASTGATSSGYWNNTTPSSSVFTVGTGITNTNTGTYVAYLFASCTGVSKVGSYTGTGTTLNIDCGFTNGARLILIKRTDVNGGWYLWDTARGIVSGNDPYLLLESAAAEVTNTDYIDPLSSGFQISSTAPAAINANGGSFIYLAIA